MEARSVLQLSQQLIDALDNYTPTLDLRSIAAALHEAALFDARRATELKARARTQLDMLRTEINDELVDREANAARIAERQQFLFQRASAVPGQLGAAERAVASATYVESALVALCPHVNHPMPGCAHIAQ